jgi:hypothetical protein
MRKQRIAARCMIRKVEASGELLAGGAGEIEGLGLLGRAPP